MQEARHDDSKINFQIERVSFFTDGVFAIAITLLVIEFKIPELETKTDKALSHALSEMGLKFLGFVISFSMIAHYWSVHHRIFGYAKQYTSNLVWCNFAFLFPVVLLPFTSGLLSEYSTQAEMKLPYTLYAFNLIIIGLMNIVLWKYISKPERKLLTHSISSARIRLGVFRSLVIPIVMFVALIVSLFTVAGMFIPFLIPVILHFGLKAPEVKADSDDKMMSNE
ncbi:MAG: TMEM175 family protein [Chitinophagales bacterium]